ncbi:hypothetical protein [Frankia sp. CiP3]|uniref:hypothetical protein n=1 Tax=Frankia sp. CiP3 TaxID=2880971 RepID=UPI001EF45586|nr:hypothetical protein [Frankia sp. CiP3]
MTEIVELFGAYLLPFARSDVRFYVGGASGIDTLALSWLAENSQATLSVVVPCTVAQQPVEAVVAIERWASQGRLAEVVELRAPSLGTVAYHARNLWMVDRSELVIGFPHGNKPGSGTSHTLIYAAQQDKSRLTVPV